MPRFAFINSANNAASSSNLSNVVLSSLNSVSTADVNRITQKDNHIGAYSHLKVPGILSLLNSNFGAGEALKGSFALWGNAFTNEEKFTAVGEAKPTVAYGKDTTMVPWASAGKILTGLVLAKMMEEGYLNGIDKVSQYIPEFNTTGKYIVSATVKKDGSNNYLDATKSENWDVVTANFNGNDITINTLLAFNLGLAYDFTLIGYSGETALWGPLQETNAAIPYSFKNLLAGGYGPYLYHHLKYSELAIKTDSLRTCTIDMFKKVSVGSLALADVTTPYQSLINLIAKVADGTLPLIFKPSSDFSGGNPIDYLTFQKSLYGPCYELLGAICDKALRNPILTGRAAFGLQTYANGFAQYARVKFLTPLGMTNTRILYLEPLNQVTDYASRLPMPVIRRDGPMLFGGKNPLDPTNAMGLPEINVGVSQLLQYVEIAKLAPTTAGNVLKALVDVGTAQTVANITALGTNAYVHNAQVSTYTAYPEEATYWSTVYTAINELVSALQAAGAASTTLSTNITNWATPKYVTILPVTGQIFFGALQTASAAPTAENVGALNTAVTNYIMANPSDTNFTSIVVPKLTQFQTGAATAAQVSAAVGSWLQAQYFMSLPSTVRGFLVAITAFSANPASAANQSAVGAAIIAYLSANTTDVNFLPVVQAVSTNGDVMTAVNTWATSGSNVSTPAAQAFMSSLSSGNATLIGQAMIGYLASVTSDVVFAGVVVDFNAVASTLTVALAKQTALSGPAAAWAMPKILRYKGTLYWANSASGNFTSDGIVSSLTSQYTYYNASSVPAGGDPIVATIADFSKLIKFLINGGVNESGVRLINIHSLKYFMTPKVTALADTYIVGPWAGTEDFNGSSSCMGLCKFNQDVVAPKRFVNTPSMFYMSGITGISVMFDIETGYYLIHGTHAFEASALPVLIGSFAIRDVIFPAIL